MRQKACGIVEFPQQRCQVLWEIADFKHNHVVQFWDVSGIGSRQLQPVGEVEQEVAEALNLELSIQVGIDVEL